MSPRLRWWSAAGATHIGRVRASNQDAYVMLDDLGCWIVADGMGGHPGGGVASETALEAVVQALVALPPPDCPERRAAQLSDLIRRANEAVRRRAEQDLSLLGMGTTLVVLAASPECPTAAVVAHVGDSRAYLLRSDYLEQLTHDHSLVEESRRRGLLSEAEAAVHPLRHVLARAVGPEALVEPEVRTLALQPGDRLLLCTDGLTKMLTDDELRALLGQPTPVEQRCRTLIREANDRGGEDNITVVLIDWLATADK